MRRPGYAMITRDDLVVRRTPPAASQFKSVANLHALDRLNPHQGASQLRVQSAIPVHVRTQPRRQTPDNNLHHTAQGVAILLGGLYLRDHDVGPRVGLARTDTPFTIH